MAHATDSPAPLITTTPATRVELTADGRILFDGDELTLEARRLYHVLERVESLHERFDAIEALLEQYRPLLDHASARLNRGGLFGRGVPARGNQE